MFFIEVFSVIFHTVALIRKQMKLNTHPYLGPSTYMLTNIVKLKQFYFKAKLITTINCGVEEKAIFYVITFYPSTPARTF